MTRSRLPEITVICRNGHPFATRAAGGITVRCKTCRAPKNVPADRPRTAREAADFDREHQDHDHGRELASRWEREPPWDDRLVCRAGVTCPECFSPLDWEPGRTLVSCECRDGLALPAAVASHYAKQQSRSREIAGRDQSGPVAIAVANAHMSAARSETEDWLDGFIGTLGDETAYDRGQWQMQARRFAGVLNGFRDGIRKADMDTLAGIRAYIVSEVLNSAAGSALRAEYAESQNRMELAEQRELAAREAERDRAEREAERARVEVRQIATREPRAITAGPAATVMQAGPFTGLAKQVWDAQERKSRAIAERGECAFRHPLGAFPADGVCGIPHRDYLGTETGYVAESPQLRACEKHAPAALAHLRRQGYNDLKWWPHAS